MGRIDKMQQWRMDGLARGLEIAKEGGIEALEKEVRFRNATKLQMDADAGKVNGFIEETIKRIYATYTTVCFYTLNNLWGHGQKGLRAFKERFDSYVKGLNTTDCYGQKYLDFKDMAKELNEKYDIGIDFEKVEMVDEMNNRMIGAQASIPAVYLLLKNNGYGDAAGFLRDYIPEAFKEFEEEP